MDFAENPLELFLLLSGVPDRENRAGALGKTPIPAMGWLAGGDGGVEEHEGSEGYLGVCSVRVVNGRRCGRRSGELGRAGSMGSE